MEIIINFIKSENFSIETLRYFYSSIFQGYAAVFTLGSMFYIYYSGKVDNKRKELEDKAMNLIKVIGFYPTEFVKKVFIETAGVFKYIEEYIIPESESLKSNPGFIYLKTMHALNIVQQVSTKQIKSELKKIVKLSILILLFSLICLYFIDYNNSETVNNLIFFSGIIFLIISIKYFILLRKLVFQCIGMFHSSPELENNGEKKELKESKN